MEEMTLDKKDLREVDKKIYKRWTIIIASVVSAVWLSVIYFVSLS